MKRLLLIPVCFVALLAPVVVLAGGGEGGFDGIVQSLESRYHVHATRIPFIGLISAVAHRSTSGGVSNMHVAEFEDFNAQMDGEELNRMVESKLGEGWERVIRETSRQGGSQTLIFMHPEGSRMGMFVLDADGHELDVVQLSVDPSHLAESVAKYDHHSQRTSMGTTRTADGGSDSNPPNVLNTHGSWYLRVITPLYSDAPWSDYYLVQGMNHVRYMTKRRALID